MLTTNNTPVTSGSADKAHGHNNNRSLRLSRQPAAIRYSALAGLGALLLVAAPAAWSFPLFTNTPSFNSSYGAGSLLNLGVSGGNGVSKSIDNKTSGGDGLVSTTDSSTLQYGTASASTAARANAASGQLGGYASGTGQWASGVPSTSGAGWSSSEFYNTYTLSGTADLTPTVNLGWILDGAFSQKNLAGLGKGTAELLIGLHTADNYGSYKNTGAPLLLQKIASSYDYQAVNLSGLIDLSTAYQNLTGQALTVGDGFLLDATLRASADGPAFVAYGAPVADTFSADFLHTAALTLTSPNPNVTIHSAAGTAISVPEPDTLYLMGLGAIGLVWISEKRRWPGTPPPNGHAAT